MNCRSVCLSGAQSLGARPKISRKRGIGVQGPTQGRFRNAFIARASDKEEEDMYEYGKCGFRNIRGIILQNIPSISQLICPVDIDF